MNKNIELKEEISFDEYKAWLTGMLRGKGRNLPDLNDWKAIKTMMDKVVPDVVEVQPPTRYIPSPPSEQPDPLPWWKTQPTCGGTAGQDENNITIGIGSSIDSVDISGTITQDGIEFANSIFNYCGAVVEKTESKQKSQWDIENKICIISAGFEPIKKSSGIK